MSAPAQGDLFGFGTALAVLKAGGHVRRETWGPGECLVLYMARPYGTEPPRGTEPLIVFSRAPGMAWQWETTHADLLAEDWSTVAA